MSIPTKRIRERVNKMNNAWAQGAPTAVFNGISQSAFNTKVQAAGGADREIDEIEAQLAIKKRDRDGLYDDLNTDSVKIRDGIEGHPDFGKDHPILEPMGFVRESERRTGLTRKKTTGTPPTP